MFPMDNGNPLMPAMMGVIAGQQAMQRAAQEEQTELLEAQVFWTKWSNTEVQDRLREWWWCEASWPERFDWFERTYRLPPDQAQFLISVVTAVWPLLSEEQQAQYHEEFAEEQARRASLRKTPTNKPRRKGWFRK